MRRPILATALLPASLLLAALPAGSLLAADEKIDLAAITRIRDEAFNRSKAQETLSKLTEIGRASCRERV